MEERRNERIAKEKKVHAPKMCACAHQGPGRLARNALGVWVQTPRRRRHAKTAARARGQT